VDEVKVRDVIQWIESDGAALSLKEVTGNSSMRQNPVESRSAAIPATTCREVLLHQSSDRPQRRETMKKLQYLVRINKDLQSDWGASVPDLPGCVATGKTIDAALRRIQSAITLHLKGMREDGVKAPPPRHRSVTPRRTDRFVDFYATIEVAA
jgi:predicted RNase H-like HicB family nuclease